MIPNALAIMIGVSLGLSCCNEGWARTGSDADQCETINRRFAELGAENSVIATLEQQARDGNCTAAARLVRRAQDAEGYAKVHCSKDVLEHAAEASAIGADMLDTPDCQD